MTYKRHKNKTISKAILRKLTSTIHTQRQTVPQSLPPETVICCNAEIAASIVSAGKADERDIVFTTSQFRSLNHLLSVLDSA